MEKWENREKRRWYIPFATDINCSSLSILEYWYNDAASALSTLYKNLGDAQ